MIVLIYIAFISLGLPDGLLGVAWPGMRASFGVSLDSLGILLFASTTGYLTSSFFNGVLIKKMGVGGLLAASCCSTGIALIGYTLVPVWWFLPLLAVLAGLGAGAIDAGLNTYVEANYGESLMQWLHASFGIGVSIGPIIMTTGLRVSGTWHAGYLVVGLAQLILAISFVLTMSMWKKQKPLNNNIINYNIIGMASEKETDNKTVYNSSLSRTLKHSPSWLSALLFFVYAGVELSLGHWAYTLLTESRGIRPEIAGLWVGCYWGAFTIGRILAGFLSRHIQSMKLLKEGLFLGLVGSLLLWWSPEQWVTFLAITITGFAIAPIFPALVSSTSYRVGKEHTSNTIGIQIAAAGLGAALLPGLAGILASNISLEVIPVFLVVLLLLFFILHRVTIYIHNI